jgi:hypothetical protein
VDEAVDLLHRFDPQPPSSKKPQPTKEASFRPSTGPWKPRWREQLWKKPGTHSGSRCGTGDGTADNTVQTSDTSETSRKECRRCGGRGHWEKQCPSPSSSVNWVSLGGCHEDIRSGNIAGKEVQDIIIDAGSGASIVASDMLPRNPDFRGYIYTWLAGFDAEPKRYCLPIIIDGRSHTAPMAVVQRETLRGNSALLGIPGLSVKQVLCPSPADDNQ